MSDVAYAMTNDHEDYELINGQVYMMSRPNTNHMKIELNIATIFDNYLSGKRCVPFNETDVFFDDDNNFVPDVIIVCDPEIIEDWLLRFFQNQQHAKIGQRSSLLMRNMASKNIGL